MNPVPDSKEQLGWRPFFNQQLSLEEFDGLCAGRVIQQFRGRLEVASESGVIDVPLSPAMPPIVVGDWLLFDDDRGYKRLLDRFSLFSRKAAGTKVEEQLIAANVDTAFVVSSLNQDINLSRIERYLALVHEAGVEPVIVLTKADLAGGVEETRTRVQALDRMVAVEVINALDPGQVARLSQWCPVGKTVLFLGSSGVGKSTLVNSLLGESAQETAGIREDDSKGRHTTTGRSLHLLRDGGLLLDTPGMRELQLADVEEGVDRTFSDIVQLARDCRFADCQHEAEPGCQVLAACESGELDERRLGNYRKILREQAQNSASLAEKRLRDKSLSKHYRSVQSEARKNKTGG